MKSTVFKVITLFLVVGLGSGFLSIFVTTLSSAWGWAGLGVIFAAGSVLSVTIANLLQWLTLKLTLQRCISAALIIVAAYPVSVLVMIMGQVAYESLYARNFTTEWHERVYSGSFPYTVLPLYLAAVVGAVLVSAALSVLTHKWEKGIMLLLLIAGLLTIPLGQTIAFLLGARNWHLILFPVGEALFGAFTGYWLLRANSRAEQSTLSNAVMTNLPSPLTHVSSR